jgi:RNA 2',3'-cyclic 3'-phosphodiesterase
MRLFVGIPLAAETRAGLSALVARLHKPQDGLRWTSPESWHITLQFLGEASREQMECLLQRLPQVQAAALSIELEQPGCFERAGVFHAGVRATSELETLQQRVTQATAVCGFKAGNRPYRPHITLARVRERGASAPLRSLQNRLEPLPATPAFPAQEFLLYESFLEPRGARYQVRGRFPLDRMRAVNH